MIRVAKNMSFLLLVESGLPTPAAHTCWVVGVRAPPVGGDQSGLKQGLQQRRGRISPGPPENLVAGGLWRSMRGLLGVVNSQGPSSADSFFSLKVTGLAFCFCSSPTSFPAHCTHTKGCCRIAPPRCQSLEPAYSTYNAFGANKLVSLPSSQMGWKSSVPTFLFL